MNMHQGGDTVSILLQSWRIEADYYARERVVERLRHVFIASSFAKKRALRRIKLLAWLAFPEIDAHTHFVLVDRDTYMVRLIVPAPVAYDWDADTPSYPKYAETEDVKLHVWKAALKTRWMRNMWYLPYAASGITMHIGYARKCDAIVYWTDYPLD